jgi:hypothetical protein
MTDRNDNYEMACEAFDKADYADAIALLNRVLEQAQVTSQLSSSRHGESVQRRPASNAPGSSDNEEGAAELYRAPLANGPLLEGARH